MHIIVIDDERLSLALFRDILKDFPFVERVEFFQSPFEALEYIGRHPDVDGAFLDIEMPEMTGIEFVLALKHRNAGIRVIFVTGHDEYARQAFRVHADGFLSKPIDPDEIAFELDRMRSSGKRLPSSRRIQMKTFGHFEVFVDGKQVIFGLSKAKELLAYLVDRRGSAVTTDQAIGILWEEEGNNIKSQNRFRQVVRSLKLTLEEYGATEIFRNGRNNKSVNPWLFECDCYEEDRVKTSFMGEYMTGYAWAESTLASLIHKYRFYIKESDDD